MTGYASDDEVLKLLKGFAHTRRVCQQKGWPTGDDVKIDSGDYVQPPLPDELKAKWEKAWHRLSPEEQRLLAKWRRRFEETGTVCR